jgi:nicotinate-nucleotide adenylyltransferase
VGDPIANQVVIVYGGSFDPPHIAHVKLPEWIMHAAGADTVLYVPVGLQPLKSGITQTPARDRLAMLRLAVQDKPWARVLTDEIDRAADGKPTYTVDTLESLRVRLPQQTGLRLLIGSDQLKIFDRWHGPARIVKLAEPWVMLRPPETRESLLSALPKGFDPHEWEPRLIDAPRIDIGSTDIRRRVTAGQPITGLVAPEVEQYIHKHRLYHG